MTPNPSMMAGFGGGPDLSLAVVAIYAVLGIFLLLLVAAILAVLSLPVFFGALALMNGVIRLANNAPDPFGKWSKLAGLVFRSLRRNLFRTALIYVALFVLTFVLTAIYLLLSSLDNMTAEKEGSQIGLMTEKYGVPSMLTPGHVETLKRLIRDELPAQYRPAGDLETHFMTWSFVAATTDPNKSSPETNLVLFALNPDGIANEMMKTQGLSREDVGEKQWAKVLEAVELVKKDKRNIIVGADRLRTMGLRTGQTLKLTSKNYQELDFDATIVAELPSGGMLGNAAVMRADYLMSKLEDYKRQKGKDHEMANSCVNLVLVRLPSKEAFQELSKIVARPSSFAGKATKVETFSAAIGTFLEPFKDIVWGARWILMPAIVVIMGLVIGITISIGVRERRGEMAVLKVLGFKPGQIQAMVVSESVLIGLYGSTLATWLVYFLPKIIREINSAVDGNFTMFDTMKTPFLLLILGPALGVAVGVVGSLLPSRAASRVKVSEVFSQVA